MLGLKRFAEECSRSRFAAICTQQGIHGFSVFIHGSVEVVSAAPHGNRGLIHSPRGMHPPSEATLTLLELGHVTLNPSQNSRMRQDDVTLRQHLDQVTVAKPVGE